MDPVLSIIVPVYKAEKYLNRCVDSILAQTYKKTEVLLIDDGSPDKSGAICDEYAEKDNRVRVFHKPNGGVSSARNFGLKEATGEYIGFVDADDYIDPSMYDVLLSNLKKYDADISICGFFQEDPNGIFHRYWNENITTTFNKEEQIVNLLSNKFYRCSIWDRIFKRELIEKIYFDESKKHYEDLIFDYEAIKNSKKAIYTSDPLYYYCANQYSASSVAFNDGTMDIVYSFEYVLEDIKYNIPKIYKIAKKEYIRNNIMCLGMAVSSGYYKKESVKYLQKNVKKNLLFYLFTKTAFAYKYNAVLISINWKLFKLLKP